MQPKKQRAELHPSQSRRAEIEPRLGFKRNKKVVLQCKKERCLQDPTPIQMVHGGVSASCEEQRFESARSTRELQK